MLQDAWTPGSEALFEGLSTAQDLCQRFYDDHASRNLANELAHAHLHEPRPASPPQAVPDNPPNPPVPQSKHKMAVFTSSEPITDRKSVFIGFSARLESPDQVCLFLEDLKQDKRIARATHNIIAWKCGNSNDNDDDGESKAGSRLAHLLDILEVDHVFVCVSRWYGGVQL
jgi:hypothetical protein